MRAIVLAFAVCALPACDGAATSTDGDLAGGPGAEAGGYTLEVRASELEQTYLVIGPDGRTVGARAAEGASALMESERAMALAASAPPQGEAPPEVLSLRVPGFELSIGGTEENANGDEGSVAISMGADGQRIQINANEGGPGDADNRALVRITGADEAAVRDFIAEQDELSPSVQAQMLAELGIAER